MILADTSVWIDHFRGRLSDLQERLDQDEIMIHPFVIGELLLSGVIVDGALSRSFINCRWRRCRVRRKRKP